MNKELSIFNIFIMFFMLMNLFILIMNIMLIHPIIIIFMLIYSSIICINMSLWKSNYLYSIMLFLIMISGSLIIFLYFSSLISNEQTNFKLNKFMLLSFILNFTTFLYLNFKLNLFYLLMKKYNFSESNYLMKLNEMNFHNILYLYEYPLNNITISSMFYLLISLFSIIKICFMKSISMRKINQLTH